jgi:hypothetical protein
VPILYVHGVNTRDSIGFEGLKPYLRRLVAPVISPDPAGVLIRDVFWGGSGATFAWNGASRPKTRLLGMGAEAPSPAGAPILTALVEWELASVSAVSLPDARAAGSLISGTSARPAVSPARLSSLSPETLSDVLAALLFSTIKDQPTAARLALVADTIAHDPATQKQLAAAPDGESEARLIVEMLRGADQPGLIAQGPGLLAAVNDRLREAVSRSASLPFNAISTLLAEWRPWLNDMTSLFVGDVLVYTNERGDAANPGPIMQTLLSELRMAHDDKVKRGEPLVVLTHSMGGQLVYDAVTHFLPKADAQRDIRIDFWCATASQVGFFEELKLFKASLAAIKRPDKVPFPHANLGVWWNVWDPNDFIAFTARDIVEGVIDESYDAGAASLPGAHGGYLARPSFFRRLAGKLDAASKAKWRTP